MDPVLADLYRYEREKETDAAIDEFIEDLAETRIDTLIESGASIEEAILCMSADAQGKLWDAMSRFAMENSHHSARELRDAIHDGLRESAAVWAGENYRRIMEESKADAIVAARELVARD